MELTVFDYVLFAVIAFLLLVGLFRGLSGELGSFIGVVAALAVGYFFYGAAALCVANFGIASEAMRHTATAVIDFVFSLLAFGLVRMIISKGISLLVPQPTNALLGGLIGLFKSVVLLGLLTGVGIVRPGLYGTGLFTAHSTVIRIIADWADAYAAGAAR